MFGIIFQLAPNGDVDSGAMLVISVLILTTAIDETCSFELSNQLVDPGAHFGMVP